MLPACSTYQNRKEDQLQHCDHRNNVDVVHAISPIGMNTSVRPNA